MHYYRLNDLFRDVETVFKDVDKTFNDTFGNFANEDVKHEENNIVVTLDIPGVAKENVEIEFETNILTVTAKRDEEKTYNGKWKISQDVNAEKISAKLENGVLSLTLPKKKPTKGTKITLD
jgi:HSP20 family protein